MMNECKIVGGGCSNLLLYRRFLLMKNKEDNEEMSEWSKVGQIDDLSTTTKVTLSKKCQEIIILATNVQATKESSQFQVKLNNNAAALNSMNSTISTTTKSNIQERLILVGNKIIQTITPHGSYPLSICSQSTAQSVIEYSYSYISVVEVMLQYSAPFASGFVEIFGR